MITPRQTRLLRAPGLAAFRSALVGLAGALPLQSAPHTFILVPTRAAGEYLRRTLEERLLTAERPAIALPVIGTRADFYRLAAARLPDPPRLLTGFEREVLLAAGARAVEESGIKPPFRMRPGLVAEMLALYDQFRRQVRTVDDFERNVLEELEREAEFDRGAAKLLEQTIFLVAAFRRYESGVERGDALDEHALRGRLREDPAARPFTTVIVTTGDRLSDPDGLWPADLDLLTRLPGLVRLDVLATEAMLGSGLLERIHGALPELREEAAGEPAPGPPVLRTPISGTGQAASVAFASRDREEELGAVARRLKAAVRAGTAAPLVRTALVVRRPLPYLYLARDVFGGAGIPFETLDTLPLAAEPYAAAVDVVLSAVTGGFTRQAIIALLRSPHFAVAGPDGPVAPAAVAALDVALADARYLGGLDRLEAIASAWSANVSPATRDERRQVTALPALQAALELARRLAPLATPGLIVAHIGTLLAALRVLDRPDEAGEAQSRRSRVRAAVFSALTSLHDAYARHDPAAEAEASWLSAAVRRWLGAQTFATFTGTLGLQIVDAQAARYGEFDDVQLVGLIDGEWPERPRRNVLYPASLLSRLEPGPVDPLRRERDALKGARASFRDLLRLPQRTLRLSTIVLENDAVVEPSMLLDEVATCGLPTEAEAVPSGVRVFQYEALALEPPVPDALPPAAAAWARARLDRDRGPLSRFRGAAGAWVMPRVSVSRLDRYLDCPFRFFASEVLRLEQEPEDEDTRTPLERGRFLHELFEQFFAAWQQAGHRRITPETLPDARALFEALAEPALGRLPASEAALERVRLLGSAVSPGIAHRVFSMEADRPDEIVERLLEFPLEGTFTFAAADGQTRDVTLRAKTDRIDLLADGSFRVIDYKSKRTPDLKSALQLPVYSLCARERLRGYRGRDWAIREAMYVSFEGSRAVVPLGAVRRGQTLDERLADAEDRMLATLDLIAAGHFPPSPAKTSLCGSCPYSTVCRKEWVGRDDE